MYSDEDLAAAVEAKILSADNVAAFRAFMAAQRQSAVADEEQFRLVTSFNDIFFTIACVLVFWAASAFDVALLLKAAVIATFRQQMDDIVGHSYCVGQIRIGKIGKV